MAKLFTSPSHFTSPQIHWTSIWYLGRHTSWKESFYPRTETECSLCLNIGKSNFVRRAEVLIPDLDNWLYVCSRKSQGGFTGRGAAAGESASGGREQVSATTRANNCTWFNRPGDLDAGYCGLNLQSWERIFGGLDWGFSLDFQPWFIHLLWYSTMLLRSSFSGATWQVAFTCQKYLAISYSTGQSNILLEGSMPPVSRPFASFIHVLFPSLECSLAYTHSLCVR